MFFSLPHPSCPAIIFISQMVPPRLSFLHLTSPPSLSPLPSPEGKQPAPLSSFELYKEERNCSHFPPRTDRLYGPLLPEGGPCCVCVCLCVCLCVCVCVHAWGLEVTMVTFNYFPTLCCAQHRRWNDCCCFFCRLYLWHWFIWRR